MVLALQMSGVRNIVVTEMIPSRRQLIEGLGAGTVDAAADARLFIRSIEERNQNLLKVATSIVRYQQEFLQHGATAMQPLILKAIAEEVDLHESTVLRLTTSKTILTPQGLFSLKHFFYISREWCGWRYLRRLPSVP